MALKDDYMLSFFEPFVKKGVVLRQEALVKFMARENGAYLKIFSDIAFKFITIKDEQAIYINKTEHPESGLLTSHFTNLDLEDSSQTVPHYRFWGTLVFKIITSEEASRSESFLFVLIPFIAKALDSGVRELQIGALTSILGSLDVSLAEKRIPFSEQYMNAFLTEICKSATNSLAESEGDEYYNLCVKTCLRILDAQQIIDRLNERLSMYSYNTNTSKYQIDQTNEEKEGEGCKFTKKLFYSELLQVDWRSFKASGKLFRFHKVILNCFKVFRSHSESDLSSIIYKCLEFYLRNDIDSEESSKIMIKLLATLNPNQEEYKIIMSYLFAVVAEHLPECKGDKQSQFSVLVLDYLENRDSFTYVHVLDQLLRGRNEKHKILDKIEEIELKLLGKSKKKVVTIETGVANKESMPVLLALYHKKKTVKKAALLTLYQQWVEQGDINKGKDSRMIISMLIQFIEERESEDILIVTFTLLESLLERDYLSEQLILQLYNCLANQFIPKHFPLDRQYSIGGYMKGVNLFLTLKNSDFRNLQILIFTL